jgi:2-iminoacetate synthase
MIRRLSGEPSRGGEDFIDDARLEALVAGPRPERAMVDDVLAKSRARAALTVEETATLLRADDPESIARVAEAARDLKREVYGKRVVLFAPLYVGNLCVNDCAYCGFKRSNRDVHRETLGPEELVREVAALERAGHKRLIVVFGEHPRYGAPFIADVVRRIYEVREGRGEIRRVNVNAAPLDVDGFREVKAAGIGTYQVFQETYHHATYAAHHPAGTPKADYAWRLSSLGRALEAGCDDVGIGALFGLYDWRFEALGMIEHALWLEKRHGVGPHTLSFPRLRPAAGVTVDPRWAVSDDDFLRLVAILRLAVPYAGMICTAREEAAVRRAALGLGVSQIDGGSRIEMAGYGDALEGAQALDREQFELGDLRTLDEVVRELVDDGHIPSQCTACYRRGRTGQHFMELAVPGFIERFCTPNALLTLAEYMEDFASPETRAAASRLVEDELAAMPDGPRKETLVRDLVRTRHEGARDLGF